MLNEFISQKNPKTAADKPQSEVISLFPGIDLIFWSCQAAPTAAESKPISQSIQINYCKSGQMTLKTENGSLINLKPGDFSIHSVRYRSEFPDSFAAGQSSGLTIFINLDEASANPPELLIGMDIFGNGLLKKYSSDDNVIYLSGNEQTESIFSAFYGQPEDIKLPYQRIKTLELLLYLAGLDFVPQKQLTASQSEQTDIVKEIHDRLTGQMDERITIEELAKQYLINPTTLKTAFKAVYGKSIAAHIKEHRMEKAAKLLCESGMSICEIARAVGYDSQSKFATAFKAYFGVLPREYRKAQIHGEDSFKADNSQNAE